MAIKQEENGKEGNVSAGEESGHGRSNQVQSGERTDDTGRGEVGKDSAGEVGPRHEGVVESEAASKETITPEQQSLLSRRNSSQYTAERESSDHKDTKQENEEKSAKALSNKQSSGQAKMSHKEKTGEKEAMSPTPAMIDRMIEEQRVDDVSELLISSELKKAAEGIAGAFGMKVVYLKKVFIKSNDPSVEDFEGNGFVRNGVIYLSLKEANIAQFTFGHELLHQLKQIDADSYMRIRQKVIDVMGRKAFEMEVKARQMTYANVPGYTLFEDYAEEVIADTLGDIITHTDMLPNIARSLKDNPSLLDRFLNVVDNVRQYFRGKIGDALGDLVNDIRDTYEMTAWQGAELGLSEPRGEREQRAANERFNNELTRYQNGEMDKNEMLHLGRPQGVMRTFLPNLPIVMRQRVIKKGSEKKHEVDVSAIMNMPQHLSSPIFVFQRSEDTIGVLTDMRDRNGKNVCVAIELKRQIQQGAEYLEVNDVRSFHGREFKNIVEPIANNKTLKWVDKEKGLAYLSSASQPVQQEIDKQVLDTATKVVKDFVNPKESEGKDRPLYASLGVSRSLGEDAAEGEREATSVRLQKADIVDAEAMAEEYGLDADDVRRYAEGMLSGNLALANQAFASIRVAKRRSMVRTKLSEFAKIFSPIEKELYERFGNINELREEYVRRVEEERSMMEAARKRAEEEQRKREARLEELAVLTDEEIDHSYAEALAKGDVAAAREMLDEAARRKGYGDVRSDYQGVGAWSAPSNPDYETDEARRNAVGEDSPDLNVEDMAAGYSNQPEDIFVHPNKYSQGLPTSKESGNAIQTAIDDIRNGKKDVTVKVYRAVPTSVKEGKLRNGDWVTPSRKYAEMHGNNRLEGKYRIIEDEVPVSELWWDGNDVNEWGYDNGKGYRYKNVKNNRKLNDLVTRDDNGNVIPPSKRFNQRKADERYQRGVGGVKPSKAEAVLRDAVIDRLRENGMEVITDVAEGQKVLDEANGKVRLMGSRTNKKMKEIADVLSEHELSEQQKTVVDVYSGKTDNLQLEVSRNDGSRRIVIRQGNDNKAGTKHSVYRHYGTTEGVITAEDILLIPEVLNRGERKPIKRGNTQLYEYVLRNVDGAEYTVLTEINNRGKETFADFYSNKKVSSTARKTRSSEAQARLDETLSAAKVEEKSKTANKSGEKLREQRVYHGSGADGVRFFRTANGEAYGFTVGGKIYVDPRIATSETPVHEYAHLWATALRSGNKEEWQNVVNLMKDSKVWDEVKGRYPELKTDDEIADEVIATYSGRRGAERLREEQRKIAEGDGGVFEKAEAISALEHVKRALKMFWKGVADFLHIHYKSAEEVADRVMRDLLEGVDPRSMGDGVDRQRYASLGVSRPLGEEAAEGEPRWASWSLSEQQLDGDDTIRFSLRQEPAPKVTKKGYAVFIYKKLKNGGYKLVPKMLSNDPGAPAQTWLNADTGYMKRDENGEPLQNTNGRASVSVNGSQAGGNKSNKLAWRPGKHLAMYPNASQFKSPDGTIPKDVIFFEVEYAADPDLHKQYQRNAWELGMNDNGQYRNNQGGLPYIPKDSYYLYRTNSISEGATPMIITGAYKINRALTDAEAKELNQNAGGMWCPRKGGDLTEEKLKDMGLDDKGLKKMTESFDMDTIKESHDESDEARLLPGYKSREINWEDKDLIHSIEENGQDINDYRDGYVAPEHSEESTIRFSLDKDKGTVVSPSKPSKAEAVLRDAVIDRLRENGMEVITDVAEGQKVLDEANGEDVMLSAKQKRALETATMADESTNKATVVSSADGAKVQNNLEVLADNYEKRPNKTRGFITDLSRSLGLEQHEASQYGTFVTENGKTFTIRVSNHNARVSFFDKNGENDGISIVISNHKNKGLLNDGNAHIIEFFYSKQSLQRADSKPLSDIISSVSETLYSGEFKDTTGLVERQEVNAKKIREQRVYHGSGAHPLLSEL